ncbi:proteinase-like protein [Coleophoma cylindrospora]|uniref:Proteinase-like protein n=1 Tax=Coleophoma cylindrospora TaxID=1849047 RepID=A0A3D8R7B8_9HELO|nr:proteinase-like protein [Coleophoma cylindrospora]
MSFVSVFLVASTLAAQVSGLVWTACGTGLDCTTIQVPLEYGNISSVTAANLALIRYKATVASTARLGSLLVNPGGPGASGVNFVAAGAGAAVSALSGGLYDIIGWDPRGVGASTPLLECFANASAEYDFANALPSAPNLWLGQFTNASEDAAVESAISGFDASVAALADACVAENSKALFTSSAAYNARDMLNIVDELDGTTAKLNYWGFSYGTVYLAEFIQAYPDRVGRIIADGVVDPITNSDTYAAQLAVDQVSTRDALNDFATFCTTAGSAGCPFATAPTGVTANVATRMDNMQKDLFNNPIVASGLSISLDVLNPVLNSLLRVPTTWQTLASVLCDLEARNGTSMIALLTSLASAAPTNGSAAGVGTLSVNPLNCIDNAPSSKITLADVVNLTKTISVQENTPLLNAGLTPISFCRNFPDTRALLANAGTSNMSNTDGVLAAAKSSILIISPSHDVATPLKGAQTLRDLLPNSSTLAIRGGSGHTSISHVSLGMAEAVSAFFTAGTLPADGAFFAVDQDVFPAGVTDSSLVTPAVFNGTYTTAQQALLTATYDIGIAFLMIG